MLLRSRASASASALALLVGSWAVVTMAVVAMAATAVPGAVAAPRATSPDDFLGLLLWAQETAKEVEAQGAGPEAAEVTLAAEERNIERQAHHLAEAWRSKHRALLRKTETAPKKAPPFHKKHAPAPKTTTAAAPAAAAAPAVWAPEEAAYRAAALRAAEEYDRSERFAHSFLHGFRPF